MHRFIVDEAPLAGRVDLPEEEAQHAIKVLRLRRGDKIELTDGRGRLYAGRISEIDKKRASVELQGERPSRESNLRLAVYMGYPKAEKLELIVQKLTELGVVHIAPVMMTRSVARTQDFSNRGQRLERIAREAVKQCGRSVIPEIDAPVQWDEALRQMAACDLVLVPWEEARANRLRDLRERFPQVVRIAIVIGPEGGMTTEEISRLEEAGALSLTLGPRILRAETAAISAVSAVMTLWGDM